MEHSMALVTGRRKAPEDYKIAEFVECDSPVPSMFEPSGATVVSIDGTRIP